MTTINAMTLTNIEIASDGSKVSINCADHASNPCSLVLPVACMPEMILIFPQLMRQAPQLRHRDPTLRLVYSVGDWRLEPSTDPKMLILTVATTDGFSVSFAFGADQLVHIADLAQQADGVTVPLSN
jgi:hypothetical protein